PIGRTAHPCRSASDRGRPSTLEKRSGCAARLVNPITRLLRPSRRLLRALCGSLLVLVADLVEADIDHVSFKLRPRGQRKAQSFLDVDELHMGLTGRKGHRKALELGYNSLGLGALAHHGIT